MVFLDWRAAEDGIDGKAAQLGFKDIEAPAAKWLATAAKSCIPFRKFKLYSCYNVWVGARLWHYGIARQYLVVLALSALSNISKW